MIDLTKEIKSIKGWCYKMMKAILKLEIRVNNQIA